MFKTMMVYLQKAEAEHAWRMAHCNDPYRLRQIISVHIKKLNALWKDADDCVIFVIFITPSIAILALQDRNKRKKK